MKEQNTIYIYIIIIILLLTITGFTVYNATRTCKDICEGGVRENLELNDDYCEKCDCVNDYYCNKKCGHQCRTPYFGV